MKMSRSQFLSIWLSCFGLICIIGSATCNFIDEYDEGEFADGDGNHLNYEHPTVENDESSVVVLSKRNPAFTPYISVGALSNMQQFFENLKENFHSLENLSQDGKKALLGRHELSAGECCHHFRRKQSTSAFSYPRARKHGYQQDTRIFRPPATAAYLHAVRNQKPSHKIKNFVAKAEPLSLRGSNSYSPAFLWTGLGKRR